MISIAAAENIAVFHSVHALVQHCIICSLLFLLGVQKVGDVGQTRNYMMATTAFNESFPSSPVQLSVVGVKENVCLQVLVFPALKSED